MSWEQICDALYRAPSDNDLFEIVCDFAKDNDFDHCFYSMNIPAVNAKSRFILFENGPEGWGETYRALELQNADPVLRRAMKSVDPVLWNECILAENPHFLEQVKRFSLTDGVAMPFWAAHGVFGLLVFVRKHQPVTCAELAVLKPRMQVIGNLLHVFMYHHMNVEKITAMPQVSLTVREREILRWTSEGKTAEVIGSILNISTRTVNFHIGNVLDKLVAVNKVQAVVKARTLGLV